MKKYPHVKMSRLKFLQQRQKSIRQMKKALRTLCSGSALTGMFDGTFAFYRTVNHTRRFVQEMGSIIDACIEQETQ